MCDRKPLFDSMMSLSTIGPSHLAQFTCMWHLISAVEYVPAASSRPGVRSQTPLGETPYINVGAQWRGDENGITIGAAAGKRSDGAARPSGNERMETATRRADQKRNKGPLAERCSRVSSGGRAAASDADNASVGGGCHDGTVWCYSPRGRSLEHPG